ncbi:hypothetical protein M0805_007605 [Coniferiporia weirii]|nr:hypothetical protein M0805_007605 [Coniferiporia weirii]
MHSPCTFDRFPPELFGTICAAVYNAGIPAAVPSLDPVVLDDPSVPTALPSSLPPSHWPEPVARQTLYNLCLVSHAWSDAAKPWLWRKVEVRLPQSWLAFVGELTAGEEDISEEQIDISISRAASAALAIGSLDLPADEASRKLLHESIIASLSGPDSSIPPELLSPPASREPSPRRLRTKSKSPARWKVMRSINDALQNVVQQDGSGFYVPAPMDPHPGRHVRRIDFSHFRTIGMRRLTGEAIKHRFVTSERLENTLKECPNLAAFGATEYMDGALTLPVLKELFLRGSPSRGRGRSSRGRSLTVENGEDADEMELERRRECKDLVAVDFTGCVSAIFFNALHDFVHSYIAIDESDSSEDERDRGDSHFHRIPREPMKFPGLQRLGLLGVRSIQPDILHPFVLAFPSLTHLDLSNTRVSSGLLEALGVSNTVRLQAIALARCTRLTGESIVDFLVNGNCTRELKHLNLYGDATYPSALSSENLSELINRAPCFTNGTLEYLDLSSSPLTAAHFGAFPAQPHLRSFGLSYIPLLPLRAIADFLLSRAPNVEVLTLISTSPELSLPASGRVLNASIALHGTLIQSLCMPPTTFSVSLSPADEQETTQDAPTRLRVLELAMPLLNGLGTGAGTWRIVRSKGGRAWYVDAASGWVTEPGSPSPGLRRSLSRTHPLRTALERLADARGNVSSGTGWHARKMEVLEGAGMLGCEDGLYGAVAFAYQG